MRWRPTRLGLAVVFLLGACQDERAGPGGFPPAESSSDRSRVLGSFLTAHWQLPVPPQGDPPPGFSEAASSLDPAICGACHPKQYAEWRTSLHAAGYSPGFSGQLIEGPLSRPAEVRACQSCHAPLGEQQSYTKTGIDEASFDPELIEIALDAALWDPPPDPDAEPSPEFIRSLDLLLESDAGAATAPEKPPREEQKV